MEEFSRVLSWFGPLGDATELLRLIELQLAKTAFHGPITVEEANKLLSGGKVGSFLVRFSSTQPGFYAVSYVERGQDNRAQVCHMRFERTADGMFGVHSTMELLVEALGRKLGVRSLFPCP